MTDQRVRAIKLASELGVGLLQMQGLMHDLGITAPNGGSLIAPKDATRIRHWFENQRRLAAQQRAAAIRRENAAVLDNYHDLRAPRQQQIGLPGPRFACACCGRNVGSPSPELIETGADLHCPLCVEHYEIPDEPVERELERLRAHDADLRTYAGKAWVAQCRYRDKMKAAFRSRDTWRATFAEVVLPHEPDDDGVCRTCRQAFPCSVWTAMEDANPGVFREMEKLAALDEEELEEELYPERVKDRDFDGLTL